jgi:hypothetical protein
MRRLRIGISVRRPQCRAQVRPSSSTHEAFTVSGTIRSAGLAHLTGGARDNGARIPPPRSVTAARDGEVSRPGRPAPGRSRGAVRTIQPRPPEWRSSPLMRFIAERTVTSLRAIAWNCRPNLRCTTTGGYWRCPPHCGACAAAQMTTRDLPLTAGDLDTQEIHNATMKIALFRQLSQIQVLASSSLPEWWDAG